MVNAQLLGYNSKKEASLITSFMKEEEQIVVWTSEERK